MADAMGALLTKDMAKSIKEIAETLKQILSVLEHWEKRETRRV